MLLPAFVLGMPKFAAMVAFLFLLPRGTSFSGSRVDSFPPSGFSFSFALRFEFAVAGLVSVIVG